MTSFTPWEWGLAVAAALIVGISKAGIGGLGMLSVVIFAQLMPAKQATGMVLPLLCFGDIVAAATYRQHAKWHHIGRLFPWTAAGVLLGYFALDRVDDGAPQLLGEVVAHAVDQQQLRPGYGGGRRPASRHVHHQV